MHRYPDAQRRAMTASRLTRAARPGFSLVELIVVLAVTAILTGMLFPALSMVRENMHRVVSSANMRQIGLGTVMYDRDYDNKLMYSYELDKNDDPRELMALHIDSPSGWDGLGLLVEGGYVDTIDSFYNPAHRGEHPKERYEYDWHKPDFTRIYGNYHYGGHMEWDGDMRRMRTLNDGRRLVIATDGMRDPADLSHDTGMNILRGDGSVAFREDPALIILLTSASSSEETFKGVWKQIEDEEYDDEASDDSDDGQESSDTFGF